MDLSTVDMVILFTILLTGVLGFLYGGIRLVIPFCLVLVISSILYTYPQISIGFENKPLVNIFFYLLMGFIALVIFAVVARVTTRVTKTIGLGPLNRVLGTLLGLLLGGLLVGAAVWGIQTYNLEWKNLLQDSNLAADARSFFEWIMAWTQKFLPSPKIEEGPWWKRPLW